MARTARKSPLKLTTVAHKRFAYEHRSGCSSRAGKVAFKVVNEAPVFIEDDDGHLIRQWKPSEMQRYTNADIKIALRGRSTLEAEDMLEWVPPSAVKYCVTKGWLFPHSRYQVYYVTRKAAAELDLPHSVGGRKISFYDNGL